MTTFNLWLEAQAGRGDDLGVVALTWVDAKGTRPKRFGTDSVLNWLREQVATIPLADERALAAIAAAKAQFHEVQGNLQAVPLVAPLIMSAPPERASLEVVPDGPPAGGGGGGAYDPSLTPPARQIAEAHGWIPPAPPVLKAPMASIDERLEALERVVGERLAEIAAILAELRPLVALAREVGEATAAEGPVSAAFTAGEPVDPLELLEEGLGEPQPVGSLYGEHVVPREQAWEQAWQEGDPAAG